MGEIHQRLAEREIFTAGYTALGYAKPMERQTFLDALFRKRKLLKCIFKNEAGVVLSNERLERLYQTLNPDRKATSTALQRGNQTAHSYTIKRARAHVKNPELIAILNLLSKGQPTTRKLGEASVIAYSRLAEACTGLQTVMGGGEQ